MMTAVQVVMTSTYLGSSDKVMTDFNYRCQ